MISVIVAMDNASQLDLNVLWSPGLREIGAEIIVCRDADSAAAGFASGATQASEDWLLLCDPDVYIPRGTGFELIDVLGGLAPADAATTLLGFAGLVLGPECGPESRLGRFGELSAPLPFPAKNLLLTAFRALEPEHAAFI